MTNSPNRPDPSKRKRVAPAPAGGKSATRRSATGIGSTQSSRSLSQDKAEAPAKKQKPTKSSRASKIPRTTTTSKVAQSGGKQSIPGHRYVASSSVSQRIGSSTTQGFKIPDSRQAGMGVAPGQTSPRMGTGQLQRGIFTLSPDGMRAKNMPQTRTPSASNEFVAYTKTHLKVMIPVFLVIALLVVYTCVDIFASSGKIHPGVTMQGVQVGGMTVDEAAAKINDELSPQLSNAHVTIYESDEMASSDGAQPISSDIEQAYADEMAGSDMNDDGSIDKWNITAETIGAYIDGEALAEKAYLVGRNGNFVFDRLFAWFGGANLNATVSVREERFNTLSSEINQEIGKSIVDSNIRIDNGAVTVVDGSDGLSVDQESFIKRFSASVFTSDHSSFIIPMKTDPMHIKPATAQKVADDVKTAIADDVTIVHAPDIWVMDSADLGEVISQQVLAPDEVLVFSSGSQKVVADGTAVADYETSAWKDPDSGYVLQAFVDQEKTDAYLVGILGPLATGGAKDAYFDTTSGDVVLVESVEGFGPDRSAAEIALQTLLFGEPDAQTARERTITLYDVTIEPALTTEDAQAMGITERLATWTIPLSGSSERINNIKLLCSLINNSLVAPGATWSFNGTTGERTAEKGFQTAPVIVNGRHEDQLGGGICQIATCIFNAACYSGLGIAERVNHDFYIASYDDYGFADATVSWRSPDLKWVNDMSTYVLMTAVATDDNVVVSFWGTKDGRTVECQRGEWKPGDKYVSITEIDPEKAPGERAVTQTGQDGRSIDIRYLAKAADGTVLHDVTFHSIYSAQNEIISVGN